MQTSKVCPWKSTIRVECCDTSWTSNRRSSVFFFDKSDIFENRHGRIFTHVYHLLINYCGAVAYSPPVTIFIVFFLANFEPHNIPKTAEMFISRVFFYQYNRSNPCRWFSQKKCQKIKAPRELSCRSIPPKQLCWVEFDNLLLQYRIAAFSLTASKKKMKKRYITVIRFSILDFQPFSCNRASGMFIVTKHKSLTLPDSAFSFRKSLNKKSFLCFSAYSLSIRGTPFFVRLILCRKLFKRLSQLQVFFLKKKKHIFFSKINF